VAFGDISVDVAVEIPRLPKADEKLWVRIVAESPGGMGANAAAAFATLGGRAALVASVGNDERGAISLADLTERGVNLDAVAQLDGPTFWTLALLGDGGEKSLLQFATRALYVPWATLDWAVLDGATFAHTVADEGEENLRLMEEAARRGVKVSVDIEPVSLEDHLRDRLLRGADVVFTTLTALLSIGAPDDPAAGARWLLERGPRIVAITLGRDGCLVASGAGSVHIPGMAVEALDTTGAGDCFAGAFLYAICRGRSEVEAATLANTMAALSTTAIGSRGHLASRAELSAIPRLASLRLEEWVSE
jgi:ribokinase